MLRTALLFLGLASSAGGREGRGGRSKSLASSSKGAKEKKKRGGVMASSSWGAANTKVRDGRAPVGLARLLHALWGLDHYPRYLERWGLEDIDELEGALEATLVKVRAQRRARVEAEAPRGGSPFPGAEGFRVRDVLAPGVAEALGWAADATMAEALAAPETRRDVKWFGLLEEERAGVYALDLFQPQFCDRLLAAVDGSTTGDTTASIFPRANLDALGVAWVADLLLAVAEAVARRLFAAETGQLLTPAPGRRAPLDWRHAYILKYEPKEVAAVFGGAVSRARDSLVAHTDDSEVTVNVALGRTYEGGDLLCGGLRGAADEEAPLEATVAARTPGRALVHLGRQLHAVSPVLAGERRALICWCRAQAGIRSTVCPCCWMNRRAAGHPGDCICGPAWN